jgi:osmoprotectant transport system ATP-binding protein
MITFDGVTKDYPGSAGPAVEDFDHTFSEGTITALVGSSGCGKTTLLRMINRMVDPTAGRVLIDGEDVAGLDPVQVRRRIGYVIQGSGLLPHRTVEQNVLTVPSLRREAPARDVGELLELVGLPESLRRRYPAELSGGQAQRVGVARALAHDPKILLMDEPFGAVDPVVRRELQAGLRSLQDTMNKTILLVTHDMDEAVSLADEIVLLADGARITQAGPPAELLRNPASDFVRRFIGSDRRTVHLDGDAVRDGEGRIVGFLPGAAGTAGDASS